MSLFGAVMALGLLTLGPVVAHGQGATPNASSSPDAPGNRRGLNEVGVPPGTLTRVDKTAGIAVISGEVYHLPAGLRVLDRNGAIRSRDYLKPGMSLRYQSETPPLGSTHRPTLTEIHVLSHDPDAVVH
ncbi:MAG: hypothetical protein U5S82_13245 [Gammaproteobacteria bacterium]|nr:hypothetical protein [Gammaproteobacteria bacterium]